MSKQKDPVPAEKPTAISPRKPDTRPNISTADDVNVDEDNAIESPKESLTATKPEDSKR
ncbi:hypothetical protein [Allopusillimonas ginsengisoli]|uniref:hypothetical protein n=1 Tax=Allopusillimonas ginsengisoli TaxID=453575 RepID=UPI001431CBDB|nr:hypothetical protein [Allopusillimonas ginsengisoli]